MLNIPNPADHKISRRTDALRQVHSVVQWLARVERSYGIARGFPVLYWWKNGKITTGQLDVEVNLELRLSELVLQFTEQDQPSNHPVSLEERSPAHLEAWILIELLHRGIDRSRFSKDLPYDISHLMSGDGTEFSLEDYRPELNELMVSMSEAAALLLRANGQQNNEEEPIFLCPLDLSLQVETRRGSGVILGFSLGTGSTQEPFYYKTNLNGKDGGVYSAALENSRILANENMEAVLHFLTADIGAGI